MIDSIFFSILEIVAFVCLFVYAQRLAIIHGFLPSYIIENVVSEEVTEEELLDALEKHLGEPKSKRKDDGDE